MTCIALVGTHYINHWEKIVSYLFVSVAIVYGAQIDKSTVCMGFYWYDELDLLSGAGESDGTRWFCKWCIWLAKICSSL